MNLGKLGSRRIGRRNAAYNPLQIGVTPSATQLELCSDNLFYWVVGGDTPTSVPLCLDCFLAGCVREKRKIVGAKKSDISHDSVDGRNMLFIIVGIFGLVLFMDIHLSPTSS
jgi:hypothetical protein